MHYFFQVQQHHVTKVSRVKVTKFDPNRNEPIDTYYIIKGLCDCPAYRAECKHIKMLREWVKLSDPPKFYWDDELNKFVENPFADTTLIQEALE